MVTGALSPGAPVWQASCSSWGRPKLAFPPGPSRHSAPPRELGR